VYICVRTISESNRYLTESTGSGMQKAGKMHSDIQNFGQEPFLKESECIVS
jgi:hypothetical protein